MSPRESNTAADPSNGGPPFPVVGWGYEPQLVDFRVAELVRQLTEARQRGDQAEQALLQLRLNLHTGRGQGPDGAVETDPAQVLERAGMMAAPVMAEAGWRVEATLVAAGAKAAERLKAAAEQA